MPESDREDRRQAALGSRTGDDASGQREGTEGQPPMSVESGKGGTRQRILDVALELFTEHGYDGTSLREIAERLGVSKAALYYHFKSKDEILYELVGGFMAQIEELADWAERQPRGEDTRVEVLRRATEIAHGPGAEVMRMLQQNQTAAASLRHRRNELEVEEDSFGPQRWMQRLWTVMTRPEDPYEEQLRGRMALMSVFFGAFLGSEIPAKPAERKRAALSIATELLHHQTQGPTAG